MPISSRHNVETREGEWLMPRGGVESGGWGDESKRVGMLTVHEIGVLSPFF